MVVKNVSIFTKLMTESLNEVSHSLSNRALFVVSVVVLAGVTAVKLVNPSK